VAVVVARVVELAEQVVLEVAVLVVRRWLERLEPKILALEAVAALVREELLVVQAALAL
jgi:hypothetical protein